MNLFLTLSLHIYLFILIYGSFNQNSSSHVSTIATECSAVPKCFPAALNRTTPPASGMWSRDQAYSWQVCLHCCALCETLAPTVYHSGTQMALSTAGATEVLLCLQAMRTA